MMGTCCGQRARGILAPAPTVAALEIIMKRSLLFGSVGLISCSLACQQGNPPPAADGGGDAKIASLEKAVAAKPAKIVDGLGTMNHPVSTANVEAQKFFNQGMAYLYGFNHAEA